MITGEERLREFTGGLYSDVSAYEGRPTDSQVARADVLARELNDVVNEFTRLAGEINSQLQARKLAPVQVPR